MNGGILRNPEGGNNLCPFCSTPLHYAMTAKDPLGMYGSCGCPEAKGVKIVEGPEEEEGYWDGDYWVCLEQAETPPEPHEMSDPLLPPRVDRDRASDEAQDQHSMILTAF